MEVRTAATTTSGSRLNSRLRDTPAAVAAFTPEFLADIRKSNIDFDGPSDGASVEAMVKALYATPKPVVDRVTELRNRVD